MKKRTRTIVTLLVILALVFSLAACGSNGENGGTVQDGEAPYKFIIGHSMADDTSFGYTMAELEKELEASGYFDVDVYGSSILGGESEVIQAVQNGEVQMYMTISGTIATFVPGLYVFDYQVPWIGNPDEGIEVYSAIYNDEKIKSYMTDSSVGTGLRVVGFSTLGYRTFTCNKYIKDFADWKGVNLRTIENPIHMAAINSWGATAVPLSFSEVYAGLQQGLIDGQSNPPEPTYSSKLYEPQKYITNADHVFHTVAWVVSEDNYNSYSPEAVEVLEAALSKATNFMTDYSLEHTQQYLDFFKENGCDTNYLPYATKKAMQEAAQGSRDMIPKYSGQEAYDLYLTTLENCKKELGYDETEETYNAYLKEKGAL